jgi:PKD domain
MQAVAGLSGRKRPCGAIFASLALALVIACFGPVEQASAETEGALHVFANGQEAAVINTAELQADKDIGSVFGRTSVAEVAWLAGISPESLAASVAAEITVVEGFDVGGSMRLSGSEVLESKASGAGFRQNSIAEQVIYEQPGASLAGKGPDAFRVEFSITGELLKVNASCTPAPVGEPVKCSAEPKEGSGAGWTYTWDFGDEGADGTARSTSHTYTAAGTYSVHLTVKSESGAGGKRVAVPVAAPDGTPDPGSGGPGTADGETTGPTSQPGPESPGSGTAPPDSVTNGPDHSAAKKTSKGDRRKHEKSKRHRPHQPASQKSDSVELGPAGRGGPGSGGGAGTGIGVGGESGATAGPGAADPNPDHSSFEEAESRRPSAASPKPHQSSRAEPGGPSSPLVEGLLLTDRSGNGAFVDRSASASRHAQRLQQAAAGGLGGGGSWGLGPVTGVAALILVLAAGGAYEWISSGRRPTWVLGVRP